MLNGLQVVIHGMVNDSKMNSANARWYKDFIKFNRILLSSFFIYFLGLYKDGYSYKILFANVAILTKYHKRN